MCRVRPAVGSIPAPAVEGEVIGYAVHEHDCTSRFLSQRSTGKPGDQGVLFSLHTESHHDENIGSIHFRPPLVDVFFKEGILQVAEVFARLGVDPKRSG